MNFYVLQLYQGRSKSSQEFLRESFILQSFEGWSKRFYNFCNLLLTRVNRKVVDETYQAGSNRLEKGNKNA